MNDEIYYISLFKYQVTEDKSFSVIRNDLKCNLREDACFLIQYFAKQGYMVSQLYKINKKTKQKYPLGIKELEDKIILWGDE